MSAQPQSQPDEAATLGGQPWELGPPPVKPGRPALRGGLPFGWVPASRTRRAAYRIGLARRVVAALLAATAVWTAVRVLAPPPAAGRVGAVVATRDLAAGTVLGTDDVAVVHRAAADLPSQFLGEPGPIIGQALAGQVTEGEVLTSARLRGRGLLTGRPPGDVAVGIPLTDATLVPSLRVGDSVSVHGPGMAHEVTRGTVLAVPADGPSGLISPRQGGAAGIVLAVPASGATALAAGMGGPLEGCELLALGGSER